MSLIVETSPDTEQILSEIDQHFMAEFGEEPDIYAVAPSRINLIGEHTDYTGGLVLPVAIDRRLIIAARPIEGRQAIIHTTMTNDAVEVDLDHEMPPVLGHWSTYFLGVMAGFQRKGLVIPGFQALIHSHIPVATGLSSSAAYEVAATALLQALTGKPLGQLDAILVAQTAEHEYANVPCGIMDQFVCTTAKEGHALLLDCDRFEAIHVPFHDNKVELLIVESGVSNVPYLEEYRQRRRSTEQAAEIIGVKKLSRATSEWLDIKEQDLGERLTRRARHVIDENARVRRAAVCLKEGNWVELGQILNEGQKSLEENYDVSHPRTRQLLDLAKTIPNHEAVLGARVTGMGFGGCVIFLVESSVAKEVSEQIASAYEKLTGFRAPVIATRPSSGVELFGNRFVSSDEDNEFKEDSSDGDEPIGV